MFTQSTYKMKRIFTILFAVMAFQNIIAQCDPMAHDFQGAAFGVYPPDSVGLQQAEVNVPYEQVLYFKIPNDANNIDPTYPVGTADIDSVRLTSITYNNGVSFVPISGLGLSVDCNPTSCMFLPNQQYCGRISGTPNTAGVFPVTINVDAFATVIILGPQVVPYSFPDYVLTVNGPLSVIEPAGRSFSVAKMYPNPAADAVTIPVSLTSNDKVEVSVMNLVGENVAIKSFNGVRGMNNLPLNLNSFDSGVYLVTVKSGNHSSTQKLVVE